MSLAHRILLTIMASALAFSTARADRVVRDSADVHFRLGRWQLELGYDDNGARLDSLLKAISALKANSAPMQLKKVTVTGAASPEGSADFNYRLSRLRADAIFNFISLRENLPDSLTVFHFIGCDWTALRALAEADRNVPGREQVLRELDRIIDSARSGKSESSGGIERLRKIDNGNAYRYLYRHFFASLRKSTILLEYEGVPVREEPAQEEYFEEVEVLEADRTDNTEEATTPPAMIKLTRERFALKTNMLYDALLLPNLELEWLINRNWSLAIEGNIAWWSNEGKHKKYRLSMFSPEVRRWFKVRNPWHGLFVGFFAGGGLYDLENGATGYRGEGGLAGLSVGYMWPISKHLSLEASVGAGYMLTRYKEYVPFEGHNLYQRTKTMNYFGPLKLKLSLVWRIAETIKQKQTDSAK